MSNVTHLHPVEIGEGLRLDARDVLEAAKDKGLSNVLIIGTRTDGEIYIAGTDGASDSLMLIEQAKKVIVP